MLLILTIISGGIFLLGPVTSAAIVYYTLKTTVNATCGVWKLIRQ